MLAFMPDRLASGLVHQPFADVCLESAHHTSESNPKTRSEQRPVSKTIQPVIDTAAFLARLTASAPGRVHSIPIHPPR